MLILRSKSCFNCQVLLQVVYAGACFFGPPCTQLLICLFPKNRVQTAYFHLCVTMYSYSNVRFLLFSLIAIHVVHTVYTYLLITGLSF